MVYTRKADLVSALKAQIATNCGQAIKALCRIWEAQTEDEQTSASVNHHNGVGFTPFDAPLLTSLHDQYVTRGYLTFKQTAALHKMMPKYANQLIDRAVADGKIQKTKQGYTW